VKEESYDDASNTLLSLFHFFHFAGKVMAISSIHFFICSLCQQSEKSDGRQFHQFTFSLCKQSDGKVMELMNMMAK
jgi:hypothetical protein